MASQNDSHANGENPEQKKPNFFQRLIPRMQNVLGAKEGGDPDQDYPAAEQTIAESGDSHVFLTERQTEMDEQDDEIVTNPGLIATHGNDGAASAGLMPAAPASLESGGLNELPHEDGQTSGIRHDAAPSMETRFHDASAPSGLLEESVTPETEENRQTGHGCGVGGESGVPSGAGDAGNFPNAEPALEPSGISEEPGAVTTQQSGESEIPEEGETETGGGDPETKGNAVDREAIIAYAMSADTKQCREDKLRLAEDAEEVLVWSGRSELLMAGLPGSVASCLECLRNSGELRNTMAAEVQEGLLSRQQGLELIGRMLSRLDFKTQGAGDLNTPPTDLAEMTEEQWRELCDSLADEDIQAAVDNKLKSLSLKRWQLLAELRKLAEGRRKTFLNFIERHFLPVLDALEEGAKISTEVVDGLSEKHGDQADWLREWLKTYGQCRDYLLAALEPLGIFQMKDVKRGDAVDYLRHEPFEGETDPDLEDEHVKFLDRNGYELIAEGVPPVIIRAARVIAVKNKGVAQ